MDTPVLIVLVLLAFLINYIYVIWSSKTKVQVWESVEGFTDATSAADAEHPKRVALPSAAKKSTETWIQAPELFDSFYASVYDQLAQGGARLQAETGLALHAFRTGQTPPPAYETMTILDAGCGTGIVTAAMAKLGAKVIAVDSSRAMLDRVKKTTLPQSTLTQKQKDAIEFRESDLLNPSALAPGEITNAVVFYFVLYYMRDLEAFFRNLYVWTRPGGVIAVEVVNKYKFDPMLDSAAPWLGFSLQKYSKERVMHSKVTFDKFEYEGRFDLIDPVAEFRETFRFKDGSVRRQKHVFLMPAIPEIVATAQQVGWKYDSYVDLTSIGFEYAFLLIFRRGKN